MVKSICNPCVIMDMELESSCFGMEGSKMEGGLMKILGRATLSDEKELILRKLKDENILMEILTISRF